MVSHSTPIFQRTTLCIQVNIILITMYASDFLFPCSRQCWDTIFCIKLVLFKDFLYLLTYSTFSLFCLLPILLHPHHQIDSKPFKQAYNWFLFSIEYELVKILTYIVQQHITLRDSSKMRYTPMLRWLVIEPIIGCLALCGLSTS